MVIRIGHTAEPDDAFMYWGLATGAVDTHGFEFEPVIEDIQTLNEWAFEGRLEVSAISAAAYPLVQQTYALLPHGASMASGRGPLVVGPCVRTREELRSCEIVIPGVNTTAFLVLKMFLGGEFPHRTLPLEEILAEVREGRAEAGLVIHEGDLTPDEGLEKSVDLGEWWLLETGLPLPLGVNVARRDLGPEALYDVSATLRASLRAGLEHREEAMRYAMKFGRVIGTEAADRFAALYANELTCDYGDEGQEAVRELYRRAEAVGEYSGPLRLEFVE
jgi:1,4-dihydroxy-6-naphthoate synthase